LLIYQQDILVQLLVPERFPITRSWLSHYLNCVRACLAKNLLDSLNHTLCDVDILLSSQRADTLELIWSL
jgi:hypothetical protein